MPVRGDLDDQAERVARGVGVHPERFVHVNDDVIGQAVRPERDDLPVGGVKVVDEQVDVCLLRTLAPGPGWCNVVVDALERQSPLLIGGGDGDPVRSAVMACVAEYRFPEAAFLVRVCAFEHNAEQASYGSGHGRSLPTRTPTFRRKESFAGYDLGH
jgi:hypothetical protein